MAVGRGREGRRRRRELERKAEKLLRRAPEQRTGEGGGEYAERLRPWLLEHAGASTDFGELWNVVVRLISEREAETAVAATDSWEALARRFLRREGGSIHITDPAAELLARYGFDVNVAIYRHFRGVGSEGGTRSYLRVGESSGEDRVGVMYAPDRDAVVVWRWGEYKNDPPIAVLEEMDVDATDEGERAAGHPTEEEFAEHVGEEYLSMVVAAGIEPTLQAAAVMRGEDVDPTALRDRYEQLIRERGAGQTRPRIAQRMAAAGPGRYGPGCFAGFGAAVAPPSPGEAVAPAG